MVLAELIRTFQLVVRHTLLIFYSRKVTEKSSSEQIKPYFFMPERYNLARLISQIKKNRARCIRNRRFFDQCNFGVSCLCYPAEGWLWITKKVWLNLLKQTLA
jgi:hypothetical protein